jgi:hypothetical protein
MYMCRLRHIHDPVRSALTFWPGVLHLNFSTSCM